MKRTPSIAALESAFPGKGAALKRLLTSADAVREHPAAVELQAQAYNPHPLHWLRLHALNAEAQTYGVEFVPRGANAKSPGFFYLNTGDTYAPTIVRFASGTYAVKSWGDIVERGTYA